jgi:hypothetical protein
VTTPELNLVEKVLLALLERFPDEELSGRRLRSLLQRCGIRRTAPAFYFTMLQLEDKGWVTCREEVRVLDGVEVKDRFFRRCEPGSAGT